MFLIIFPIPIPKLKPSVALQSTGAIRTGEEKKKKASKNTFNFPRDKFPIKDFTSAIFPNALIISVSGTNCIAYVHQRKGIQKV